MILLQEVVAKEADLYNKWPNIRYKVESTIHTIHKQDIINTCVLKPDIIINPEPERSILVLEHLIPKPQFQQLQITRYNLLILRDI